MFKMDVYLHKKRRNQKSRRLQVRGSEIRRKKNKKEITKQKVKSR